ncbi:MAG: acyl-CoA dehydrogenase family protein [Chloroflexota bacterium]|nr:acyl-CoA dehydrogenase family protein [Chloroflexota bacterium]MDE3194275.1 acyl-CoA dehydrogenase family protein [Chloroflexota bacterium]
MLPAPGADERALADGVAAYAADLAPRIPAAEEAGAIPRDVIADLGRLGVLGMTVPEEDGGLGASSVAFALVLEEIAAVWPSLAVGVSVNSGITEGTIVRLGTPEQKRRWLPRLIDGSGLGSFALTEPQSGSDAAALRTTARRDGGGWVLNGRKMFVTNLRYAPVVIVLARVGEMDAQRPHAGVTAFLVPTDAGGVVIGRPERKMGLLASDTSPLTLEDARVGADALLGPEGKAFGAVAMAGLDGGRIGIAAQAVGIARGAIDRAAAYALERRQFGHPIADFQLVRNALARARTDIAAARLLMLRAAWLKDRGRPFTTEASQAKLFASEMAQRATRVAVQTLGGYGYMREAVVERMARDARATTIYEGTSEIQRIVIARGMLSA